MRVPFEIGNYMARRQPALHYSTLKTVFHCYEAYHKVWVGVAGDGDNGGYEWFLLNLIDQVFHTSDCGYGDTLVALRDGLIELHPIETKKGANP